MTKNSTTFRAMVDGMRATTQLLEVIGAFATSDEVGVQMNSLVNWAGRWEQLLSELKARQQNTLLNLVPFDIKEAKRAVNDLMFQVREYSHAHQDNTDGCMRFIEKAATIAQHLTDIEAFLYKTGSDMKLSYTIYNNMLQRFQKEEWVTVRASLVARIKRAFNMGRGIGQEDEYILHKELDSLKANYMNGHISKALSRLYQTYLDFKESPARIIVEYRDELTEDDISNFFTFVYSYGAIYSHIKTLPLLEPLTGDNAKLFTSKTAEKYFETMLHIIFIKGEIESLAHYGILLMALGDLELAQLDNKPYAQMKNYLTEKLPEEELLQKSDQEMIALTVRNAQNKPFCELEKGVVEGTKFKPTQIEKYQDVYWRCFTLLSQGGRIMPKDIKLASYLTKPHPLIDFDRIMEDLDPGHRWWINFYRSVLRGKSMLF